MRKGPHRHTPVTSFSLAPEPHVSTPDPPQDPCAGLLFEIQRGDEAAFAELYRRYAGTLLLLLLKKSPEKNAAENALAEIFTHIWTRPFAFDPAKETGRAWLCGLVARHGEDRR